MLHSFTSNRKKRSYWLIGCVLDIQDSTKINGMELDRYPSFQAYKVHGELEISIKLFSHVACMNTSIKTSFSPRRV